MMSEDQVEIRRLRAKEWQELRDIRLRMLREAPAAFGSTAETEGTFSDNQWQAWSQDRSIGVTEAMFVATNEGRWIGCVTGSCSEGDPTTLRVWAMWVEPRWRGRGVGYLLLDRLRTWSQDSGFATMRLKVAASNRDARRLYERFGFDDTGERSGMRRDPTIPMIAMALSMKSREHDP